MDMERWALSEAAADHLKDYLGAELSVQSML